MAKKTKGMIKENYTPKVYTKTDLVNVIAEVNEMSKAEAERQLNNVILGIENAVTMLEGGFAENTKGEEVYKGDKIQLTGFLTLERAHRTARQGHSPRNPEEVLDIPAKDYLKAKVGKSLGDLLEG